MIAGASAWARALVRTWAGLSRDAAGAPIRWFAQDQGALWAALLGALEESRAAGYAGACAARATPLTLIGDI